MNLITLILISLLAGAATGIGGILGVLIRPSEKNLVFGLGFASGIMLGVTFLMLVPESLKAGFILSFIGFTAGSLLLLVFLRLGTLVAIGIAIHDLPEGFGIGSGYGVSGGLGLTIAVAMILHNIPEGMAIAIPLHFSGMNKFKNILITFAAGMSTLVGALVAFFVLGSFPEKFMYTGLAFAAGAMFYITVNELIPEAHKYGNTRFVGLGVLTGALAAFLLTQIG
jgi:ZIP family zinc transporter